MPFSFISLSLSHVFAAFQRLVSSPRTFQPLTLHNSPAAGVSILLPSASEPAGSRGRGCDHLSGLVVQVRQVLEYVDGGGMQGNEVEPSQGPAAHTWALGLVVPVWFGVWHTPHPEPIPPTLPQPPSCPAGSRCIHCSYSGHMVLLLFEPRACMHSVSMQHSTTTASNVLPFFSSHSGKSCLHGCCRSGRCEESNRTQEAVEGGAVQC